MRLQDMPIRRKLMLIILATSVVVMLLMNGAFFVYTRHNFRSATHRQLSTLAEMLAANSTAALAFQNQEDAREILAALKAERHVVSAALYGGDKRIFARYPDGLPGETVPSAPGPDGFRFAESMLAGFQPVTQDGRRLGTLYLSFDMATLVQQWLWGSIRIAVVVMAVSLGVAYLLSRVLQQQISRPIVALADTARAVSDRRDYSVRALKLSDDEVGGLTDAFNQMLAQIEAQNQSLRKHETQLRTIIENLGEGLAVSDLDGQLLHFNRAALQLHGFASLDECLRRLSEFAEIFELATMEGEVLPIDQWPLARILRGEQLSDLEIRIRRPASGWQRVFRYGGTLVRDPEGKPMMAVVTINDITERKRAADEILRLNANLEQRVAERTAQLTLANRELESFSYSVSHDLRAPLRHIDGYAQLLQKRIAGTLDATDRRYLDNIINSAKGLGTLIDELLAFSRMARSELRYTKVDIGKQVQEVVQSLQPDLQGRRVEWRIGELPVVQADPAMLRQVWQNLVSNAVKYSRQREEAVIEVSHRIDGADGNIFVVRDNGAGFDMQYASKLFGVFQRLHTANEFEGTGIGLANVRRIVQRHGGRTWAEGTVGKGAAFFFTLPRFSEPANSTKS